MKNHQALIELRAILRLPDWTTFCPEKLREEQFEDWCNRWVIDVEFTQAVVNTKYLDSEYSDVIKTKLGQSLGEDLTEECVSFKTQDKRITASMCALRRKEKV